MESYRKWAVRNRGLVASIESVASTLMWFLPERFTDSELGAEAVSSLVGLFTVVNRHIIDTVPLKNSNLARDSLGHLSSTSRDRQSDLHWPFSISFIKELEVLVEVAAEHYRGQDKKWSLIATVEAAKVLLRLIILHKSGYNMLLSGGEVDYNTELSESLKDTSRSLETEGRRSTRADVMRVSNPVLEERAKLTLAKFGERSGVTSKPSWLNKEGEASIKNHPETFENTQVPSLFKVLQEKGIMGELMVIGEILIILRPLVYVLLLRRYGLKSWNPWIASLAINIAGIGVHSFVVNSMKNKCKSSSAWMTNNFDGHMKIETEELKRRQILLVFYIMRDPFFSIYARKPLEKTQSLLKPVPLLGRLAGKAIELLFGIQGRYFYTSAS